MELRFSRSSAFGQQNEIEMAGRKPGTPKTGGRHKGTPNKVTRLAKDAIAAAAEELGGADRLVAWAREDPANERVFWGTIYPKLLPLQVSGDPDAPVVTKLIVEWQQSVE
jgi:hypothetical protein